MLGYPASSLMDIAQSSVTKSKFSRPGEVQLKLEIVFEAQEIRLKRSVTGCKTQNKTMLSSGLSLGSVTDYRLGMRAVGSKQKHAKASSPSPIENKQQGMVYIAAEESL